MTGKEYQEKAARTINKSLTLEQQMNHALHGMVGEIGEIHSLYQKVYQGHEKPDREHIIKELGDLMWFAAEFSTSLGISFDEVLETNIDKLIKRYPEGFDVEHSLHRAEGDI